MTPTAPPKLLTAEEFAKLSDPPDGSKQELVRGEVVTMPPPGFEHGDVQGMCYFLIKLFLQTHPIGRVVVESGMKTEGAPDTVRGPDVSYWSFKRLPPDRKPKGYADVFPEIAIEVRSPDQSRRRLRAKAKEYLQKGVLMVWIVDPEERCVTVYRQPDEGRELGESATLSGEEVLPGFSCKVAELFA